MIHNPPGLCKNWGALFSCLTVSSADTQMWRCRPWNCRGRLHIFFCCTEVEWNSLCSHQKAECPIPDHSLCLRLKKLRNFHKWWHTNRVLYILTSVWFLHTENASQTMLFQKFSFRKASKGRKSNNIVSKKMYFLKLHRNAGRRFYSQKTPLINWFTFDFHKCFNFLDFQDIEKADFDQRLECKAPKLWSKYTICVTFNELVTLSQWTYSLEVFT